MWTKKELLWVGVVIILAVAGRAAYVEYVSLKTAVAKQADSVDKMVVSFTKAGDNVSGLTDDIKAAVKSVIGDRIRKLEQEIAEQSKQIKQLTDKGRPGVAK